MVEEWRVPVSDFAIKTNNPIRSLVEALRIEPNPNKPMIALSIGDPTTFGNLRPPEEAIKAVESAAASGLYNGYAASTGCDSARQAVAKYSSTHGLLVKSKDVILCSGCSSALDLCILVLAERGSNILVPRPGFSIYRTLAEGMGITTRYYNLDPLRNWEVDLKHLESQIDINTACILINNPSNPCGSVFSKNHLRRILEVAARYRLPIIADEIYEHLVFPGADYYPIAALSNSVPVLSCSGLTKRFLVPGWRMGWIVIHDRCGAFTEVRKGLERLAARIMGSNTLIQAALPQILSNTPEKFFSSTIETLHKNATLVYSRLEVIPGLRPIMPQGAMYMMVCIEAGAFREIFTGIDFVEKLVAEESVFCLPGDCFQSSNYIRLVLSPPEDILVEACDRIEEFCHRYSTRTPSKIDLKTRQEWRDRGGGCENQGREP